MATLKNEAAKVWVRDADAFLEMCRTTKPDPDDPFSWERNELGELAPEYDLWRASAEIDRSDLLSRMSGVHLVQKVAVSYRKRLDRALEPDSSRPIRDDDIRRSSEARERVFRKNPPLPLDLDFEA